MGESHIWISLIGWIYKEKEEKVISSQEIERTVHARYFLSKKVFKGKRKKKHSKNYRLFWLFSLFLITNSAKLFDSTSYTELWIFQFLPQSIFLFGWNNKNNSHIITTLERYIKKWKLFILPMKYLIRYSLEKKQMASL